MQKTVNNCSDKVRVVRRPRGPLTLASQGRGNGQGTLIRRTSCGPPVTPPGNFLPGFWHCGLTEQPPVVFSQREMLWWSPRSLTFSRGTKQRPPLQVLSVGVKTPLHPPQATHYAEAHPLWEAKGTDSELPLGLSRGAHVGLAGGHVFARKRRDSPVHAACRKGSQTVLELKVEDIPREGVPSASNKSTALRFVQTSLGDVDPFPTLLSAAKAGESTHSQ